MTGFTNADLSVANGTLSAVSSSDGGITWTATFTPSNGVRDLSNVITLNNTGVSDLAGNAGVGTTSSANYTVDTVVPTATVVVADTALRVGETSLVTITFSEAVSGFTLADLSVANGTLSGLSSSDGGITWTATLTPTSNVEDTSNLITLDNTGVVGASSGNAGIGSTDSNNYAIDTRAPSVTSVGGPAGVSYNAGDALVFVVNVSEAVQVAGSPRLALDIGGHTVFADLVAGAGTTTLVFQYTIQPGDNDSDGVTVTGLTANGATLTDAAGNAMNLTLNGVSDTHQVLVDTQAPTAVGIVTLDPSPSNAQSVRFTVTFSEQVSGVDLADFTLVGSGSASGTLSGLQALGGGVYVITVSGVSGTGTLGLNLNGSATGITDVAGNALVGGSPVPCTASTAMPPRWAVSVCRSASSTTPAMCSPSWSTPAKRWWSTGYPVLPWMWAGARCTPTSWPARARRHWYSNIKSRPVTTMPTASRCWGCRPTGRA